MTLGESLKIEGRKAGLLEVTEQLLEDAVGTMPDSLMKAVGELSPEALAKLIRSIHTFKQKEDLEQWLGENG